MLVYLIYFSAGFIIDVFYTMWYAGISDKKIPSAMLGSFLVTLFGYTLVYELVLGPDFLLRLFAYAFGCALGTGISMWYKNIRSNSKSHKEKD